MTNIVEAATVGPVDDPDMARELERTTKAAKKSVAAQHAAILKASKRGWSLRNIETVTGIPYRTVQDLLRRLSKGDNPGADQ